MYMYMSIYAHINIHIYSVVDRVMSVVEKVMWWRERECGGESDEHAEEGERGGVVVGWGRASV